jgi:hypothetical protein
MVLPQKRTNATKGVTATAATTASTTIDDTTSTGSTGNMLRVHNDNVDDLITSPSKTWEKYRIERRFQKPSLPCGCRMTTHENTILCTRIIQRKWFSFLCFSLLLLLIISIIGYRNNFIYVELYQPPQQPQQPTVASSSNTTQLPELRQHPQRLPPRLRKRWYGNPFRSQTPKNDDESNKKPQPQKQFQQFRLWDQLWKRRRQQDLQLMQYNQQRNQNIFQNANHTITLTDLTDLNTNQASRSPPTHSSNSNKMETQQTSPQQQTTSTASSSSIIDMVQKRMGIHIDAEIASMLPTWEQITKLYGRQPILYGIDTEVCQSYRNRMNIVPPHQQHPPQRYVGVAGQMNTGTNALAKYLLQNIYIPPPSTTTSTASSPTATIKNSKHGILWTVPWYKHSWSSLYQQYHYDDGNLKNSPKNNHNVVVEPLPKDHSHVLAVVLIRDPYFWMQR